MGGTGLADMEGDRYSPKQYEALGRGGRGGVGAAGGLLLTLPTVSEIHSLEMAWTSGEIERRGDRGRGRGEVVSRLRMGFLEGKARCQEK